MEVIPLARAAGVVVESGSLRSSGVDEEGEDILFERGECCRGVRGWVRDSDLAGRVILASPCGRQEGREGSSGK